jgi:hypothetical protein
MRFKINVRKKRNKKRIFETKEILGTIFCYKKTIPNSLDVIIYSRQLLITGFLFIRRKHRVYRGRL